MKVENFSVTGAQSKEPKMSVAAREFVIEGGDFSVDADREWTLTLKVRPFIPDEKTLATIANLQNLAGYPVTFVFPEGHKFTSTEEYEVRMIVNPKGKEESDE